jgi:hypothetical protein
MAAACLMAAAVRLWLAGLLLLALNGCVVRWLEFFAEPVSAEECGVEAVEELSMNMSGLVSTVRSSLPTMEEGAEEQEEEEEACSREAGAGGGGGVGGPAAGTAASQLQSRSKLLQGSGTSRQLQV